MNEKIITSYLKTIESLTGSAYALRAKCYARTFMSPETSDADVYRLLSSLSDRSEFRAALKSSLS